MDGGEPEQFAQPLLDDRNALVYVFRESLYIGSAEIPTKRMAILANEPGSDGVVLRAPGRSLRRPSAPTRAGRR